MKKVLFFLIVISVLGLTPTMAADLQAGWYVKLGVNVNAYDSDWEIVPRGVAWFHTDPGQYGPFLVTDGPFQSYSWRDATVTSDTYGVGPESSLILPFSIDLYPGDRIAYLSLAVRTNYDPSHMYLDLWRDRNDGTPELIWTQRLGGERLINEQVAHNMIVEGPFYFQVNVIPEPASLISLLMGTGYVLRRRARSR